MTQDEVFSTVATRCSFMSRDEWADFISLPPELQAAKAQLVKDSVLAQPDGPSAWTWLLGFLGTAATVVGDASGIGSAYATLKALA